MAKSTADKLRDARALLAKPNGWTKGEYARNAMGDRCVIESEDAVCFCFAGALERVRAGCETYSYIREQTGEGILRWNDCQAGVEPVLDLLDKAIEHFEARSKNGPTAAPETAASQGTVGNGDQPAAGR